MSPSHRPNAWCASLAASILFFVLAVVSATAQGVPIRFDERFALASDRSAVLGELIPGTPDYYFYQCLHHQQLEDYGSVDALLKAWIERHGRTHRVVEIENRQALLRYDEDPAGAFDLIRRRLNLRFDATRRARDEQVRFPSRLDPALISRERLTRRAFARHRHTVDGFHDTALRFLAASDLDDRQLANWLGRLTRPDIPNLPALVARELADRRSRGFGALEIHGRMLLAQLDELARLRPQVVNDRAFIDTYVARLRPNDDVQWRRDAAEREAYLERLQAFAQRLAPSHNSLKAHVLFHRLVHDLGQGVYDKDRFLEYLRLPRSVHYVNQGWLKRARSQDVADLQRDFVLGFPAVRSDSDLVTAYLSHYFRTEESFAPYADFCDTDFLRRLFAETKILAGVGDMERWYSMLDDASYYEFLKDRVEIDFAPTQRSYYGADDAVSITVDVKNVPSLLVKVFEINTFNYHRDFGRDVDASIDLDGMVASIEKTYEYDEAPVRRVRRTFEFSELKQPGTYIVEFIGNGLSSRAVIQKGSLELVERLGAAGHVFRVVDEAGQVRKAASVWFGGREYEPDDEGEIVVPFSTDPGRRTVVLRDGRLTSVAQFEHRAEAYALSAGIFVPREALTAGRTAAMLVRPTLTLHGERVSLDLLEDPRLTITATDQDGVSTSTTVTDLELSMQREWTHELRVPQRTASLSAQLTGHVRSLSESKDIELAAEPFHVELNAIDRTRLTGATLLGRDGANWVLDVLGKNGEPRPNHAVKVSLHHVHFKDPVVVDLATDARGRVELGRLPDIHAIEASAFDGERAGWQTDVTVNTMPSRVCAVAGSTVRIPYLGLDDANAPSRDDITFLELRHGHYTRDAFDRVALTKGFVELRELAAGDYELYLPHWDRVVSVRVTDGEAREGWAFGDDRRLELRGAERLQMRDLEVVGDKLRVRLANAGPGARVHVFASRFVPAFDPFAGLVAPGAPAPVGEWVRHPDSSYHSGREIGDEYRYILERRNMAKFPGNMLRRPGLLLNPWAFDEANTAIGLGGGAGGRFGGKAGKAPGRAGPSTGGWRQQDRGSRNAGFPNLDFLPHGTRVFANLEVDDNGELALALEAFGGGRHVHVVAADEIDTVYREIALEMNALEPRDRRLQDGLDSSRHFVEQRVVEFFGGDDAFVVEDVTRSDFRVFDSIESVFELMRTISSSDDLERFRFLLDWPGKDLEEKLELYAEHACHELHFFLFAKDREFFDAVVRPYLANKANKTFLDDWLLERDLQRYVEPWAFAELNLVEQILLTRTLDGLRASGARHVRDLFDLVVPDESRRAILFATTLMAEGLAADGKRMRQAGRALGEPDGLADRDAVRELGRNTRTAADEEAEEARPMAADDFNSALGLEKKVDKDMARRRESRRLYRAPDVTQRFMEHDYWHRRRDQQGGDMIGVNAFWRDFATAPSGVPFVSTHVAEATSSFAEMMLALAVLDLPFRADEASEQLDGNRLTKNGPLLVARKDLRVVDAPERADSILINQNFYRLDARYRFDGNERRDNFIAGDGEFVIDTAYGCQVVLTNPTSSPRTLELLLQIPRGALPVEGGFYTRGRTIRIEPFATATFDYGFYFPSAGTFGHFPAHVTADAELAAFATPTEFEVLERARAVDTTSWEHVSQDGSLEEVYGFLDNANLRRLDLSKVHWRLRERRAFDGITERLRRRHVYDHGAWSYGVLHRDPATTREFLRHADGFVSSCGAVLDSRLLAIDPVERHTFELVEFHPLFNARAHRFGAQREILNHQLGHQYNLLMSQLCYRDTLRDSDWMRVTYYLLLQDRVGEALEAFDRVRPDRLTTRLQYDYMQAYLAFYREDTATARRIAEGHRDHPVARWRAMFRDVLNQLDEIDGAPTNVSDADDRGQEHGRLAAQEPALDVSVEARQVRLRHANVARCEVNYYEMDVEFSFSTSPFVKQGSSAFAYIRPNRTDTVSLSSEQDETVFDLPAEFQNANVLVEVRTAGLVRRQTYFANSLDVRTSESFGRLRVANAADGKPLPKVYVKVYKRTPGGEVRFHKDGYTDLRGKFDYASVSGDTETPERFAILVLSEADGAVIREVDPPTR